MFVKKLNGIESPTRKCSRFKFVLLWMIIQAKWINRLFTYVDGFSKLLT
jgi:hypothetical protein